MDATGVALAVATLHKSAFQEFKVFMCGEVVVPIKELKRSLKYSKDKNAPIILDFYDNVLKVSIGFIQTEIKLFDARDYKDYEIPELKLDSSFCIDTKLFYGLIEQVGLVSDYFFMELDSHNLIIRKDRVCAKVPSEILLDIRSDEHVKSQYPMHFIKQLKKVSGRFKSLSIELDSDAPMKMSMEDERLRAEIYIAPRIGYED